MASIVQFPRQSTAPDPQQDLLNKVREVQLSLAQSTRTLALNLAALGETLHKLEELISCIDDVPCRERLLANSASIHSEILQTAASILRSLAPAGK